MKLDAKALLILLLVSLACVADEENKFARVEIGQSREQIRIEFGQPDIITTFKKKSGPIWGPEERFWDKIPDGTMLEVWRYSRRSGQWSLYFLENRDTLAYMAFAPVGVVYESGK